MTLQIEEQIIQQFMKSQHVLLLPSAPADGDSLGSALALYLVLTKLGKKVTVISPEPVPKDLKFLPMMEKIDGEFKSGKDFIITVNGEVKNIQHEIIPGKVNIIVTPADGATISKEDITFPQGLDEYDLSVTVDTGDLQQLGKFYEQNPNFFYKVPLINIDHHASNSEFGTINHVEITASATTQMLLPIIKKMEVLTGQKLIDEDVATLLLAGLVTDTGSFQHSNTTPQAFSVAAELLDLGARQQEIIKNVYKTKSLATLKLWGQVLSKIQFAKDHRFVWSTVSQKDLDETGADLEDAGAIIDELLNNAPGAEVVVLLKEKPGILSGSVRTTVPEADASAIAAMFGGGGHKRASGFRIKGVPFEEGVQRVVNAILNLQAERLHLPAPSPQPALNPGEETITLHDLGEDGGYYSFGS